MTLYLDLDGVFADFNARYKELFGMNPRPQDEYDDVDWELVKQRRNFFSGIPQMWDAQSLWRFVKNFKPTMLTGVPNSMPWVDDQKREWVRKHLHPTPPVITCVSAKKATYCQPGDILIDDRVKYRQRWLDAGGTWITHKNAQDSISQLRKLAMTRFMESLLSP